MARRGEIALRRKSRTKTETKANATVPLVLPRNLWLQGSNRGLTCRSTGRATAYVPGRAALWFIMLRAAMAAHRGTPVNFNVRPHSRLFPTAMSSSSSHSWHHAASRSGNAFKLRIHRHSRLRQAMNSARTSLKLAVEATVAAERGKAAESRHAFNATRTAIKPGPATVPMRGAGRASGASGAGRRMHRGASHCQLICQLPRVRPNPSFNRTRNGASPGPRSRFGHHRPRGPGATPLRSG